MAALSSPPPDPRALSAVVADLRLTASDGRFFFELLAHLASAQTVAEVAERLCATVRGVLGVDAAACYLFDGDIARQAHRLDPGGVIWFPESFSISTQRLHRLRYGEVQRRRSLDHPYIFAAAPFISGSDVLGALFAFAPEDGGLRTDDDIGIVTKVSLLGSLALSNALALERLNATALVDPVMGIPNRLAAERRLNDEFRRAQRYDRPFSVILVDLDHFKWVNDDYDHVTGDAVLRRVGELLAGSIRDVDMVARWGGEELIVLLPETPPGQMSDQSAGIVARRLRNLVADTDFPMLDKPRHRRHQTISLGVAGLQGIAEERGLTLEGLTRRADAALYAAKHGGRNTWVAWRADLPEAR